MMCNKIYLLLIGVLISSACRVRAQENVILHWNFDQLSTKEKLTPKGELWWQKPELKREHYLTEAKTGIETMVIGNYIKLVQGISDNALLLDGISSFAKAEDLEPLPVSGDFSIGAWLALAAYPLHWVPVAENNISYGEGFSLGVDANGYAGFKIFIGDSLYQLRSDKIIPLRKWTSLEGTYSGKDGIRLYVNKILVESMHVEGAFNSHSTEIIIGRSSIKERPVGTIRPHATEEVYSFLDGIVDELIVYNDARTTEEVSQYFESVKPKAGPPLEQRELPSISSGKGSFGAVYTTLNYYPAYDVLWKVGNHADIVVRFPDSEAKFVFWRGTGYIPQWISENNIWYTNSFLETWSELGCHEPMSDKRTKYSHVRVIENSPARVVVHWRYPLSDNWDNIARVDSLTGWGEWVDELYTLYPDGVAVRKATLHTSNPETSFEWQESTLIMSPGQKPEDVLNTVALTLANTKGETDSYSWETRNDLLSKLDQKRYFKSPPDATIQITNTKAKLRPFVILDPKHSPGWNCFLGELRPDVSLFPWWNHWPTAQNPCDGRYAIHSDLASHSSLSHAIWKPSETTDRTVTKIMLNGLTEKPADQLAPLAKSWTKPASLNIVNTNDFLSNGYNQNERAYEITRIGFNSKRLDISLEASSGSPVVNPCLVINNWGDSKPKIRMNGKEVIAGNELRMGNRMSINGNDLIIWLKAESTTTLKISLTSNEIP